MIEHHLDIPTADGAMNSFVVHREEGGPHPVVLPNLYYRRERDFWLKERTDAAMAHMFTLMNSLGRERPIQAPCWPMWTRCRRPMPHASVRWAIA